jgi:hypothetical protein
MSSSASLVRELQVAVNQRGNNLVVDGSYGPNTHAATMASLVPVPPPPTGGIVPPSWMPDAKMQRIIFHWTAGAYKANSTDVQHYHILIEGDGKLTKGTPSIKLNEAPLKSGYAAHTANCNSGSIGVSCCAMAGAVEKPFDAGKYPLTKVQWDTLVKVLRELAARYAIPISKTTVLSHAEVQANLGIAQKGKWDIAILPFDQSFNTAAKVGDRMRKEIAG